MMEEGGGGGRGRRRALGLDGVVSRSSSERG